MVKIIGLGDYAVSGDPEDSIKTFALASCVGLVVYNPRDRVLGMAHIVLPDQKDAEDLQKKEGFFASTAVPLLFNKIYGRFPDEATPCRVSLFGGCLSRNKSDMFNVGERNVAKIEEILREKQIKYSKKDTGGYCSRTIEAYVKDGSVWVRTQNMK